jgi:aminoglycoside phosphotransferase (APT) family kinase protein
VARTEPADTRTALTHGDLWYGNTLWDEHGELTAVLDWDAVAALAIPPDMGWVAPTIADQGRPDLTGAPLGERREAFRQTALSHLD